MRDVIVIVEASIRSSHSDSYIFNVRFLSSLVEVTLKG